MLSSISDLKAQEAHQLEILEAMYSKREVEKY